MYIDQVLKYFKEAGEKYQKQNQKLITSFFKKVGIYRALSFVLWFAPNGGRERSYSLHL